MVLCLAITLLLAAAPGFSQSDGRQGQGQAVVTVLPKHGDAMPANISADALSIKVNGKPAKVTGWKPLHSPENNLELVVLIDGASHNSLGIQLDYIANFLKALPPDVRVAVAYMAYGRSVFAGPLSTNHEQAMHGLHLPGGVSGSSASPYFCLSELAKNWPSADRSARREVVMITDGVDDYMRRYDPEDPYVVDAITDSVRAGLVVDSIYWLGNGLADANRYMNSSGQNHLAEVTQATGGKNFWFGMGNPVSFQPYLDELLRRLRNQYALEFASNLKGKPEVEYLKLKLNAPDMEVAAPQQVMVSAAGQM